nr:UbiA family prenyltransferase [Rubellimicrobium arenae]
MTHGPKQHPIIVDLDGTLIKGDLLVESLCQLGSRSLPRALRLLMAHAKRPERLKDEVSKHVTIDAATLPYNEKLVTWLGERAVDGHPLYLATASHRSIAEPVADHLGLFQGVMASDAQRNLKGATKLKAIEGEIGQQSFAYIGDDRSDLAIWSAASEIGTVNLRPSVISAVNELRKPRQTFDFTQDSYRNLLAAMRPHQWVKNLLVFLPVLAAHSWGNMGLLALSLLSFVCFSMSASGIYLVNDLADIEDDRHHPKKQHRPIAAGLIRPQTALAATVVLNLASILIALAVAPSLALVVAIYIAATSIYSFYVKTKPGIDILWLASLYALRVVGGAAATGIEISSWLLSFCVFFFLSLAAAKRCSELVMYAEKGRSVSGRRGYQIGDLEVMTMIGVISAYSAVIVLMIYTQDPLIRQMYPHPDFLMISGIVLLYWLNRVWLKVRRGEMHHDPIVFALRDRKSHYALGLMFLAFAASTAS